MLRLKKKSARYCTKIITNLCQEQLGKNWMLGEFMVATKSHSPASCAALLLIYSSGTDHLLCMPKGIIIPGISRWNWEKAVPELLWCQWQPCGQYRLDLVILGGSVP